MLHGLFTWEIHGNCMAIPWESHGNHMGNLCFFSPSFALPQDLRVRCISWTFRRISWRWRGSAKEVVKPNNRWWYNGTFMDKNGIFKKIYLVGVYKN
jgi:hypothetical protein